MPQAQWALNLLHLPKHKMIKQSIYKTFRDGLAEHASISIDSSVVKNFILPLREGS